MDARVSMLALGVADMARAIAFYRDGLGWALSPAGNARIALFQLGGGLVLALYPRDLLAADACLPHIPPANPPAFGGITLAQNVGSAAEVDAVLQCAEAAGARLLKPAAPAEWGGYSGYFADLDGHPWEIAWNPKFPLLADGRLLLPD